MNTVNGRVVNQAVAEALEMEPAALSESLVTSEPSVLPRRSDNASMSREGVHGRVSVGLLELDEDLFAVHIDRAGRLDPQSHLIPPHLEHGHDDLVTDHDALVHTPCEHEHGVLPPWWPRREGRRAA